MRILPNSNQPVHWLTLAALAAGCTLSRPIGGPVAGGGPPSGGLANYFGTLQPSCSPVDAMALALELETEAPDDPTRISLLLWPPSDFQSGAAIRLGEPSGLSAAAIWPGDTEWHLAVQGALWVDAYQPEAQADGRFRLEFEGGKQLEGVFLARWLEPGPMFCG